MIKGYKQYIREAVDENTLVDGNNYTDIKNTIKKMIDDTIKKNGGDYNDFIDKLIKTPLDTKINGLINDSDIYEYYLKYRNDIDQLLNEIKYYDEVPSENNVFSLYDYIIDGTNRAVIEIVKLLKADITK